MINVMTLTVHDDQDYDHDDSDDEYDDHDHYHGDDDRDYDDHDDAKQASDISLTMSVWIFGQNQHWGCKLYVHAKSQPSQSVNGRDLRGGNPTSSLENSGFMTKVVGYLDVFLKVHAYNVCMQNLGPLSPSLRRQINIQS